MTTTSNIKLNIAILTTVINFELYNKTSKLFPKEIQKYIIDGSNGMFGINSIYYMFKKLSNKNIDYLILADEDVIFTDSSAVFSIIDKMHNEEFSVCGVRDGGIINHRIYNPVMVNTFFTIINFKEISSIWNKKEIVKNQYILPFEFDFDCPHFKVHYDFHSLYEPYYCFFLWLKRKNMKFLYLDSQTLDDNITNNILFENKEFALHTWYARSYNNNEKHTLRINNILSKIDFQKSTRKVDVNIIIIKDNLFFLKTKLSKVSKKILNKFTLWADKTANILGT
jgi:hypothetical protein